MDKRTVRVLVVDDSVMWRRYLRTTIRQIPGLQVVGEAVDGSDAIEKTKNLRPDLILLDVGLPKVNGIEVARRLSTISPESKIIFVSENRSPDIQKEALRAGGSAYVIKSDAARELIPTINTVLKQRNA